MSASPSHSYAWALHVNAANIDEDELTDDAAEGLSYAEELAYNGWERAHDPRRWARPEQITVDDLAAKYGLPASEIERLISLARRELFGSLSDHAIAKRAQRGYNRRDVCAQLGCRKLIPANGHGNRRYCPTHRTGKARTRRSRAKKHSEAST